MRPFPSFAYLGELHSAIEANKETIILKSRQMMVSWYCVARELWRAVGAYWRKGVYLGGMASKREDDAKELLARFCFMLERLPDWLRPHVRSQNQTTIEFTEQVRVMAFPSSANIGRTFTLSELLLDEAAYLPQAREMWLGLYPTLGKASKAVIASTPNGKFNLFYDLWSAENGFGKVQIHYSQHPERDEAWAIEAKKGYTRQEDWDREMELSFSGFAGKRVYGLFERVTHVRDVAYTPSQSKVIYRGWDFGYHYPACVWMTKDDRDRYIVLRELLGRDITIDRFARQVLDISAAEFGSAIYRDFCDPAGAQTKDVVTANSEKCSVDVLRGMGLSPEFRPTNIIDGLEQVRQLLGIRADGNTGLIVSSRCTDLIDGFLGGYHYPDKDVPSELPDKDGFYDHLMDAMRYIVVNMVQKPDITKPMKSVNAGIGMTANRYLRQRRAS